MHSNNCIISDNDQFRGFTTQFKQRAAMRQTELDMGGKASCLLKAQEAGSVFAMDKLLFSGKFTRKSLISQPLESILYSLRFALLIFCCIYTVLQCSWPSDTCLFVLFTRANQHSVDFSASFPPFLSFSMRLGRVCEFSPAGCLESSKYIEGEGKPLRKNHITNQKSSAWINGGGLYQPNWRLKRMAYNMGSNTKFYGYEGGRSGIYSPSSSSLLSKSRQEGVVGVSIGGGLSRCFATDGNKAARRLVVGTRESPLALQQAYEAQDLLRKSSLNVANDLEFLTKSMKTTGDVVLNSPLSLIGGKGLFTKELDNALINKEVDICVHSMKDLPTYLPEGTLIACCLPREDTRDAFLSPKLSSYKELRKGSVVGSASLRRQSQLMNLIPGLKVINFRGNVRTRLKKLKDGEVDATLLALAGMKRLGIADEATAVFTHNEILPAVAQGAIGIQCREEDSEIVELLKSVSCTHTEKCVECEREFLKELDGNCKTPIAGLATLDGRNLTFRGLVGSVDGKYIFTIDEEGDAKDADEIGLRAAKRLKDKAGEAFMREMKANSYHQAQH